MLSKRGRMFPTCLQNVNLSHMHNKHRCLPKYVNSRRILLADPFHPTELTIRKNSILFEKFPSRNSLFEMLCLSCLLIDPLKYLVKQSHFCTREVTDSNILKETCGLSFTKEFRCTVKKVPHPKREGGPVLLLQNYPHPLSLRGRDPYHFPIPLNT